MWFSPLDSSEDFRGRSGFRFWATVCKTIRPMLSVRCPVCLSVCNVRALRPNGCCGQMAAWIKMSLGMEVGLGPDDFVLDRDPAPPSPKGGRAPKKFSAHVYCGQKAGWMKLVLGWHGGRPQPRRLCVRWGPSPLPQRGQSPLPNFKG